MTSETFQDAEPLGCDDVAPLMSVYIASELDRARTLRLRKHLASCSTCMQAYRESVNTAASLSRRTTEEREQRMLERARNARAAAAFGRDPMKQPKRRNFRLRMVLIPAVVIYMILKIVNLGPAPGKIEVVEATPGVTIGERTVDLEQGNGLVLPGRWILTERFASASLDGRSCELTLGESTAMLVESARPVRFRFRVGTANIVGSASFVTVLGVVEVEEGRGELVLDDHGLHLEPESGRWALVDQRGTHELELGRVQSFGMQL